MTNKITCTFSIVEEIANRRKASLSYFTPEPKYETIAGTYSNCDFLLDPRNSEIIISGVDHEEIDECALHIIRILNRHQDWKFCYTEFQTECGEHDSSVHLYSGYKDARLSVTIARGFNKTDFQRIINEEYKLPVFLNILLKEAISNSSRGKYRIAFFLIYSALERVCKLLFVHHYGEQIKKIQE